MLGCACAAAAPTPTATRSTVVNQVLGGGMSSRLFQEIREKRGLGVLRVLVPQPRSRRPGRSRSTPAPSPERVDETARRHRRRARPAGCRRGVTDGELDAREGAHDRFAGAVARELVEPHAPPRPVRADAGRDPDLDEVVERVEAVTADDVAPRSIDRVLSATRANARRRPTVRAVRRLTDPRRGCAGSCAEPTDAAG